MAEVLETLLVLLRADSTQLRREFDRVERESADTKAKISRNLDFGQIGASLGGLAGGTGILTALRSMAQESARTEGETRSFLNTLERAGVPQEAMSQRLETTANRVGLLREQLQSAATPLIKMGVDADSVDKVLLGLASSAGIAGKSGAELANAVTYGAQGLAMGRSELLESSNVILNASQAWEQYADAAGKSVKDLSDQEKAIAYVQGVLRETAPDVSDFAVSFGDFAQSQSEAAREAAITRREIGALAQEGFMPLNRAVATGLGWFNDLPEPVQRTGIAMVAAGGGATALAGGLALLVPVLGALSGPAGLFILVAVGIAGVVAAIESVETRSAQGELEALGDAANTAAGKIGSASNKAGLQSALSELAEVADGEAKERLQGLIDKLDDTGAKLDEIKGKAKELAAELALAPLQAEKAGLEAQMNQTEDNKGGQSVDVLTRDYEDRLSRQTGLAVDIEVVKGEDGQYMARFADSMGQVRLNAEDSGIALDALADITRTANSQTGILTEEQRELREQLAAVNAEIRTQETALNRAFGDGGGGNNPPPGGVGTDEKGDYVVAPQPSVTVTDSKPIATPEVSVNVNGEPIDIFGVVFDPKTGTTSKGAAPNAEVNVEVKGTTLENLETARAIVADTQSAQAAAALLADEQERSAQALRQGVDLRRDFEYDESVPLAFNNLKEQLLDFTGSDEAFADLADEVRDAGLEAGLTTAEMFKLLALIEQLSGKTVDIKVKTTSEEGIPLLGSEADGGDGSGVKPTAEFDRSAAVGPRDREIGENDEWDRVFDRNNDLILDAGEQFNQKVADAGLEFGVGLANALKDGKITGDEAAGIGGQLGGALGAAGGSFLGPAGTIIGGAVGSIVGELIGSALGGSDEEANRRSQAEAEIERRGGASTVNFNAFVSQVNNFDGGVEQNQAALYSLVRRVVEEVYRQADPKKYGAKA